MERIADESDRTEEESTSQFGKEAKEIDDRYEGKSARTAVCFGC
ncbi:hypothetical protein GCM10027435_24780 [Haloparvum alkalitolerans]